MAATVGNSDSSTNSNDSCNQGLPVSAPLCVPDNHNILSCAKALERKMTVFDIVKLVSKRLFKDRSNHRALQTSKTGKFLAVNDDHKWEETEWQPVVTSLCCRVMAHILPSVQEFNDKNHQRMSRQEARIIGAWIEVFTKLLNEHHAKPSPTMKLIIYNMRDDIIEYTRAKYGTRINCLAGVAKSCVVWKKKKSEIVSVNV